MVLQITSARVDGYEPGSDSPDYQIPGEHIFSFDVEQKVGDLKDTGKVAIDNRDDRYTDIVGHGDKIELFVGVSNGDGSGASYGDASFGSSSIGGKAEGHVWTGLTRDINITYDGAGHSTLQVDVEDFVFAIMSFSRVYNEWRDRQIVGSNGIINEVLTDECPSIDQSYLPDREEVTSIGVFGETVLELVGELILRLPAVPFSDDESLRMEHPDTMFPEFELETRDWGTMEYGSQDENMSTLVRVRGGNGTQIDDEQLSQDGSTTVTDSNFATQRIETRKSFVAEIDLYTQADRTGEDIIVRLQKDGGDGAGPIAPNDETSDISSHRLSSEFLAEDGFTLFLLPTDEENVLPEPNPWMIVQTDGSTGQDIGIDTTTNELAYRAFYPYPIVIEQDDTTASNEYRRRDGEVNKKSITTFEAARDRAESFLFDNAQPTETTKFDAMSLRMHNHGIGEVIRLDEPATTGSFVAMEKKDHYEENLLNTEFSFQSLQSLS